MLGDGLQELEEDVLYEECVNCLGADCVCGGLGLVPHTHIVVDPDGTPVVVDVFGEES